MNDPISIPILGGSYPLWYVLVSAGAAVAVLLGILCLLTRRRRRVQSLVAELAHTVTNLLRQGCQGMRPFQLAAQCHSDAARAVKAGRVAAARRLVTAARGHIAQLTPS